MRRLPAVVVLCLLITTSAVAADWPQWRGPNRDGVSTETGLLKQWPKDGPKLAWQANIGGVGYSSPVVVGDKLFITGAEDDTAGQKEFIVCLNTKDGHEVWRKELPNGEGGYLNGWGAGPRGSPTIDGEYIYTLGARGELSCRKTADGSEVWKANIRDEYGGGIPGWGYSESVLIDGDNLICTPGGKKGTILALNKKTGKKVWQSEELTDGAAYASILVADIGGVRQYITQTSTAAVGVRAADGKLLWRVDDLKRAVAVIPTPIVAGNLVFFTSGYGAGCELIKLESADGTTKATAEYTNNTTIANHHGGVIRIGEHIYGHTDIGGKWVCFEYKKGGEDAVWESKELGKGSVICADGHLYCLGEDPKKGIVALVEASPEGWKEKGRFTLPEKSKYPRRQGAIWAHPVVANGKLYLRDHEILFCYEIAAK